MEKIVHEIGEKVTIQVEHIGGDLRVSGREDSAFEVQAPGKGDLHVEKNGDEIAVRCNSGCLMFVPPFAKLDIERVGGDVRITGVTKDILLRWVGGDLSLRRIGQAAFEVIGGNIRVRKMEGSLTVDRIGGDAAIERVAGDIVLRGVGGDAYIAKHKGGIQMRAGGDVVISIKPTEAIETQVTAGGDLSCTLEKGSSATVQYQCGGEKHLPQLTEEDEQIDDMTVRFGDGDAKLALEAGGDLWLRSSERSPEDINGLEGLEVIAEIDAKMAEMEAQFDALGAGLHGFDARRIGEKVRRSVARAQRKAAQARRIQMQYDFELPGRVPAAGASEEERLSILKMVEEGKINVTEAEMLLEALEGKS